MPRILRWLAITPPQAGFKPASTETLRVLATLDDTARAASSLGPWLGTSPSAKLFLSSVDFGSRRSGEAGGRRQLLYNCGHRVSPQGLAGRSERMALVGKPRIEGERYQATIPDTLDLADRTELALNGLGGSLNPELDYENYFWIRYSANPAYMYHWAFGPTNEPKFAESFPLMRAACGSDLHLETEYGLMKMLVGRLSPDDGLYYASHSDNRPWHTQGHHGYEQSTEDMANVAGNGRMLRAMVTWRERDGDPAWDDRIRALVRGLDKIAIHKDDYAYYPDGGAGEAFNYPKSGWRDTREPLDEHEGGEGAVTTYQGHQTQGLARWYAVSGDERAAELARKLTNFIMKPRFWQGDPDPVLVAGGEQGHFDSHFHARAIPLRGILEYAMVVNDERVKEFVRRSYEYSRMFAIPRIGWAPTGGPKHFAGNIGGCEGCYLGDWVALGIRLSDAGIGDYWDDVDCVVRNHLVEAQFSNAELLHRVSEASPPRPWDIQGQGFVPTYPGQVSNENVIERTLGTFAGWAGITAVERPWVMSCCTGNGTQGLYYAWEGIVRCEDGENAQVNLLLNRASPWLDIDSHLPYEGKVDIRNKTARRIWAVRVSSWIDRRELRFEVAGQPRDPYWVGNYAVFDALKPGDVIRLKFPVVEETISYTSLWQGHGAWRRSTDARFGGTPWLTSPLGTTLRRTIRCICGTT